MSAFFDEITPALDCSSHPCESRGAVVPLPNGDIAGVDKERFVTERRRLRLANVVFGLFSCTNKQANKLEGGNPSLNNGRWSEASSPPPVRVHQPTRVPLEPVPSPSPLPLPLPPQLARPSRPEHGWIPMRDQPGSAVPSKAAESKPETSLMLTFIPKPSSSGAEGSSRPIAEATTKRRLLFGKRSGHVPIPTMHFRNPTLYEENEEGEEESNRTAGGAKTVVDGRPSPLPNRGCGPRPCPLRSQPELPLPLRPCPMWPCMQRQSGERLTSSSCVRRQLLSGNFDVEGRRPSAQRACCTSAVSPAQNNFRKLR